MASTAASKRGETGSVITAHGHTAHLAGLVVGKGGVEVVTVSTHEPMREPMSCTDMRVSMSCYDMRVSDTGVGRGERPRQNKSSRGPTDWRECQPQHHALSCPSKLTCQCRPGMWVKIGSSAIMASGNTLARGEGFGRLWALAASRLTLGH